jgi:hypothetical protein
MAYDSKYYQDKKEELNKKFEQNKNALIQDMTNLMNKFYETQKDLQDRWTELNTQEQESQKKTEDANKKEIDKKIK